MPSALEAQSLNHGFPGKSVKIISVTAGDSCDISTFFLQYIQNLLLRGRPSHRLSICVLLISCLPLSSALKPASFFWNGLSENSWKEWWADEIFWVWTTLEGEDLLGRRGGLEGVPFTSQWRKTQQLILGIIRIGCVCRMLKQNRPIDSEQVAGAAMGALSHGQAATRPSELASSQGREDRGFRVDEGPRLPQSAPP